MQDVPCNNNLHTQTQNKLQNISYGINGIFRNKTGKIGLKFYKLSILALIYKEDTRKNLLRVYRNFIQCTSFFPTLLHTQ